jgi:hypothetical protein
LESVGDIITVRVRSCGEEGKRGWCSPVLLRDVHGDVLEAYGFVAGGTRRGLELGAALRELCALREFERAPIRRGIDRRRGPTTAVR